MSKIEEMAERYSFIEEGIDFNGNPYKDYYSQKYEGYIAGVNAVLKEIEKLTCLSGEALKIYLPRKIKELKGE